MKAKLVPRREQNPPTLGAVVYDAKRFLLSHSSIIEEAPLQAYCSALVFSPEASIIRRLYMHQLPEWIVRAPALSEDWSVHLQTLQAIRARSSAVAFSPDGRLIVSGSNDNTVRVWDAATGAERRVLQGHSGLVCAVALLAGRPAHRVGLSTTRRSAYGMRRRAPSGVCCKAIQAWSIAVAFSPDGRLIVSGSSDKTVRVWDTATGAERRMLQGHSALGLAPSPSRRMAGSSCRALATTTVRVWDAATGAERRVLQGHSGSVNAVAVLAGRPAHRVGLGDNTVRVWDAATGAERRVLQGHSGWVSAVAFSPDGRLIVSGSTTARSGYGMRPRAPSGVCCKAICSSVSAVAFSPDGRSTVRL